MFSRILRATNLRDTPGSEAIELECDGVAVVVPLLRSESEALAQAPDVAALRFHLRQDGVGSGHYALLAWKSGTTPTPSETHTGIVSAPDAKSMMGVLRKWAPTLTATHEFEVVLCNGTRFQQVAKGSVERSTDDFGLRVLLNVEWCDRPGGDRFAPYEVRSAS